MNKSIILAGIAIVLVVALSGYKILNGPSEDANRLRLAEGPVSVAPKAIASGEINIVHSIPHMPAIDAQVDIGTMRQLGEELEVKIKWPRPGVPGGSEIAIERIECNPNGMISYAIETSSLNADGRVESTQKFDPQTKRAAALEHDLGTTKGYGPNPRAMVCLAAAKKCINEPFSWPPPRNETPLEYSERADRMRADYIRMFLPTCKLK